MVPTTSDLDEMDAVTDSASDRSSLDALELGARLSQLSRAKVAVALNSVHHVQMCTSYDREEHVTVYVLDVFLQSAPRGLPSCIATTSASTTQHRHKESKRERRRRELREKDELRADYQVEHRYSTFRALRERIGEVVAAPKDKSHPQWCPYCTRVRELVNSGVFPSRFAATRRQGRVLSLRVQSMRPVRGSVDATKRLPDGAAPADSGQRVVTETSS
ncbi:hypothetical protein F442_17910 [Phytophthora nicotianae P10297]|uniref:PX domain-containing protein n=1 Tax=Phytophthora nicotianae P10297 TaxID=1317064 RepID=W2YFG3_PHYNI|nr:hypothetical protein F442_17910 [Phytophthora nicotianae P10297]